MFARPGEDITTSVFDDIRDNVTVDDKVEFGRRK